MDLTEIEYRKWLTFLYIPKNIKSTINRDKKIANKILVRIAERNCKYFKTKHLLRKNCHLNVHHIAHILPFLKELGLIKIYTNRSTNCARVYERLFKPSDLRNVFRLVEEKGK